MKIRYCFPPDIYEYVHEAMVNIANAAQVGDDLLWSHYREKLLEFCEQQTAVGRGSGFMWEALADISDDSPERLGYYERALAFARTNGEPKHTILLEIGQICIADRDWNRAQSLLIAAREEAIKFGDTESNEDAVSLLLRITGNS